MRCESPTILTVFLHCSPGSVPYSCVADLLDRSSSLQHIVLKAAHTSRAEFLGLFWDLAYCMVCGACLAAGLFRVGTLGLCWRPPHAPGSHPKMERKEVSIYYVGHINAGITTGLAYGAMRNDVFHLERAQGFGWWEADLAEVLYTCMLCFVVRSWEPVLRPRDRPRPCRGR